MKNSTVMPQVRSGLTNKVAMTNDSKSKCMPE